MFPSPFMPWVLISTQPCGEPFQVFLGINGPRRGLTKITQQPTHFRGEEIFTTAWCVTALNTNLLLTVCSSSAFQNQCVYNFT